MSVSGCWDCEVDDDPQPQTDHLKWHTEQGHSRQCYTVKPVLRNHSKRRQKKMVFKTDYRFNNAGQKYCRMLQGEHSAILSTLMP